MSNPTFATPELIEKLAEAVHEAYLRTCAELKLPVKPHNAVPYAQLSEESKQLDRASAIAVLMVLEGRQFQAKEGTHGARKRV